MYMSKFYYIQFDLRGRVLNLQMLPYQDKFAIYQKFFTEKPDESNITHIFMTYLIIYICFIFVEYQLRNFPRTLANMKT